jgi:hypothetical protein
VGTATADANGNWSYTTPTLPDGNHQFVATATDASGNTSQPSGPANMAVDTTPPAAPAITGVGSDTGTQGDGLTSDKTLTVTGTAEPGSTVRVYDNGVLVGTGTADANGNYSVTTSALADGNHPLTITATDTAGNQSLATSLGTWTIDTSAPNAPTVGSVSQDTGNPTDKNTSDNTLTVIGTAEPGSTVKIYDNGVLVGTGVADAQGNYSITTSVLADGSHPLSVTSTDTAGRKSPVAR